jgi:hypothetical protein
MDSCEGAGTVARVELVAPTLAHVAGYLDAVRQGWMGDRVLFGSADELLALDPGRGVPSA